jgi:hypothetical protein
MVLKHVWFLSPGESSESNVKLLVINEAKCKKISILTFIQNTKSLITLL